MNVESLKFYHFKAIDFNDNSILIISIKKRNFFLKKYYYSRLRDK